MKFKPEDFKWLHTHSFKLSDVSDQANSLLQAHIATLPKVYGQNIGGAVWTMPPHDSNTHTALLWDIEEIEKKECKHLPWDFEHPVCIHCGVKLKAKWEKA